MRDGTRIRSGQSRMAWLIGMADRTPKTRASYDAAATTPRLCGSPPTTTGLPFKEGSSSCSTEAKKASMSTWMILRTGAGRWRAAAAGVAMDVGETDWGAGVARFSINLVGLRRRLQY